MKEHPVPQHIASYQFRLVGSMTLKQFLEVAGGVVIAWITISSGLSPVLKWPIGLFTAFFGAALAFMPVEERPLDQWIISFVKTLYQPTQFIWQKSQKIPAFLQIKKSASAPKELTQDSQKTDASLEAYLKTLPDTDSKSPLDQAEAGYLNRVQTLFGVSQPPTEEVVVKTLPKRPVQSADGIKVRKLKSPKKTKPAPIKAVNVPKQKSVQVKTDKPQQDVSKPDTPEVKKPVIKIDKPTPEQKGKKVIPAKFSPQLPLPYKPKEPNRIVGMVFDANDHILTNTILEIKDLSGNSVRALKTNKLGQFSIARPLDNGTYLIEAEHETKHFDIIKLETIGEIIPPIEVRSYD